MSVLPILHWPDPRLSQQCAPVGGEDARPLIADLYEAMYAASGRGLAAPQLGVMKRLFVCDVTWKEGPRSPMAMIDPEITAQSETSVVIEEACLSVPGVTVPVSRPEAITLHWTDETGTPRSGDFAGAPARVIQHEFDHLNGLLHFDRIAPDLRTALEGPYLEAQA